MNSKELLERARESMRKQNELIDLIEEAEKTIENLDHFELYLYTNGSYINKLIKSEAIRRMKEITTGSINEYLSERSDELEKLLGIQPVVISMPVIPKFETPEPDLQTYTWTGNKPVESLTDVISKVVADTSEDKHPATDADIDKFAQELLGGAAESYPAKKNPRKKLPENMTEEAVTEMLFIKKMEVKDIAAFYGLKNQQVSNFIFQHDLRHKAKKDKSDPVSGKPAKQPEETERP